MTFCNSQCCPARVRLKQFQAPFVYSTDAPSRFPCVTIDEVFNQHRNVFCRSRKGGTLIGENVEPVKEVTPECAYGDGRLQIAIRGRNHPTFAEWM